MSRGQPRTGSALIVTLTVLAALSLMAAYTVRRVTPRLRMAYQNAGWQEARLAAEAGIDATMSDLVNNATGASAGPWTGWLQSDGSPVTVLTNTLDVVNSLVSLLLGDGTSVNASEPIFLNNVKVSTTGVPTEVDVQLWALYPTAHPQTRWFRIRAMATCGLPPAGYEAPVSLDTALRRLSLRKFRPQLSKDFAGKAPTIPPPATTRTIEALVEPILPFELAIWTDQSMALAATNNWVVDSFDSSDPLKSNPDGAYPGVSSPLVQENGNVASNLGRPPGSPYGMLISANGARVRGIVATNGGNDPSTPDHENVTGQAGLDVSRIRDDFCREMRPMARPTSGIPMMPPSGDAPFLPGPPGAPSLYHVRGNLGGFYTADAPLGQKGAIVIMVDGNLDVTDGITVAPSVMVQIYVRGKIDFHDSPINSGAASSRRAAQLQIYGENSGTRYVTLRADAGAAIYAAFYGPTYDATLSSGVQWYGALGCRSFNVFTDGTGGVHYDEALTNVGPPVSYRIARCVEDVRE